MSLNTTSTILSVSSHFSIFSTSSACRSMSTMLCLFSTTFGGADGQEGAANCGLTRPRFGSRRNRLTSDCTLGERKLPWIVETPLGGWAGIISMPIMRPFGLVRSTATYVCVSESSLHHRRIVLETSFLVHSPISYQLSPKGRPRRKLTKSTIVWPFLNSLYLESICAFCQVKYELTLDGSHLKKLECGSTLQALDFCLTSIWISTLSTFPSCRWWRPSRANLCVDALCCWCRGAFQGPHWDTQRSAGASQCLEWLHGLQTVLHFRESIMTLVW